MDVDFGAPLARCRVVGQKRFGYFRLGRHSGFSKVTRCKSGTARSRYHRIQPSQCSPCIHVNGYWPLWRITR
ncbi:Conserved Hypothetical protein [Pseudomonas brassicacearum subsp. brassicacearum NFM421]|uniref:Uncharacterized protein n=1 Tax=Pseudomonas brassicacearum (strain NFM421) TaxID=994484 RepID=F2KCK5_PSEBN|nr:Conserved Hypothetical protein [Pseudomonas brassicacearum subsp. brassicacearum NFM421]